MINVTRSIGGSYKPHKTLTTNAVRGKTASQQNQQQSNSKRHNQELYGLKIDVYA